MHHDCNLITRAAVNQNLTDVEDDLNYSQYGKGHQIKSNPSYLIATEKNKAKK